LKGNWREEHLFNLTSSLRLYDTIEALTETYQARLLKAMEALHPPDRRDEPVPTHPSPRKEKDFRTTVSSPFGPPSGDLPGST
jgi:hypothetical protein